MSWGAYFRGVPPWLQRMALKPAGFPCTGAIVKFTSSSDQEKIRVLYEAANLREDKLADFNDGVFFERSTNSSERVNLNSAL